MYIRQIELECVDQITYLDSIISKGGYIEREVNRQRQQSLEDLSMYGSSVLLG